MPSGFWLSDDQYNQSGGLLWGQQQLQQLGQNVQHQWNAGEDWAQQQISNLSGLNPLSSPAAATSPAGPAPESSPPGAPPAGLPPEQRPAATAQELGQQWADQQISSLTPPSQPQSQGTLGDVSQGVQSVLGAVPVEAQGRARQTLGLIQDTRTAIAPPHEPSTPDYTQSAQPVAASDITAGPKIRAGPANAQGQIFPLPIMSDNKPSATYHSQGGSDLMAPRGTPVLSMQGGTVTEVYQDKGDHQLGGNAVLVHGNDGLDYYYAHFDAPSALKVGDNVQAGQQIGAVGNSGNAWKNGQGETHLHVGIGHGISSGVGSEGGLGQNFNAQDLLAQLEQGVPQKQAGQTWPSPSAPVTARLQTGGVPNPSQMADYIRYAAAQRGIDPETAVRVAQSEGLNTYTGDQGSSFGPFQLHMAGLAPAGSGNEGSGLGDSFKQQTGLDPRDPSTWAQQINFALDNAKQSGWGAWHGAARVGIGAAQGIGTFNGDISQYAQAAQNALSSIPTPAPGQSPHPLPGQPGGLVTPPGSYNPAPGSLGPPLLQIAQGGLQNVQDLGAGLRQTVGQTASNIGQTAQDSTNALVQQGQNLIAQGQQLLNQAQQVGPNVQQGAQNVLGQGTQLLQNVQNTSPMDVARGIDQLTGARQLTPAEVQQAGQNLQFSSNPLQLLPAIGPSGAGLGAPTGGELSTEQRNQAIEQANPYREIPGTTGAAQFALDPTNLLLAPGLPEGALGRTLEQVVSPEALGGLLTSRQRGELNLGLILGGAGERPGETTIYGPGGEVLSQIKPPAMPGGLDPEQFTQRAVNINLAKYPAEVRDAISSMAEALPETMSAARRG